MCYSYALIYSGLVMYYFSISILALVQWVLCVFNHVHALSATSTHFKQELMSHCLHSPTLNKVFLLSLLAISSCASYVSRIHNVIDHVTRSHCSSDFEIVISPSIFQLERRSKLKISELLMAIFTGIFNSRYYFGDKTFFVTSKWRPFWKFWNIKHSFNFTSDLKRPSQIMPK